ncbi:unnamed protein product, partial [Brassica oleracea var. botrytis]
IISFSSPTLFALGSFSGLEAFSRPDLLADEAETCGEEMKLNGELSVLWVHQVDFDCPRKKFLFEVFLSSGGETVCIGGGLNATTPSRRFELEQFIENHYVSIKFSSENKQKNLNQVLDRETVSKESGKDEDENQMMRNGESVLFGKCSFW